MEMDDKKLERYILTMREAGKSYRLYDMHLHPFNVLSNRLKYVEKTECPGLFSTGPKKYVKPTDESAKALFEKECFAAFNKGASELGRFFAQRCFYHTGPYVFRELFDFVGIHKGLLLPVASPNGCFEQQMEEMFTMYSGDERFWFGGSVPNEIKNEEMKDYLGGLVEKFGIVAVKIHPCITRIDLAEVEGRTRVEAIINASEKYKLPVIIHSGGDSGSFGETGCYALIEHFAKVKLEASIPVVLAHGGLYGQASAQGLKEGMVILADLLRKNENLFVDTSALSRGAMCHLIRNIDVRRILFGSDGLYENPIAMQVRLLRALEEVCQEPETAFVQIAGDNWQKAIFS